MAGLVADHELRELGHDPLILEAQNRPGGRVHTLRCFTDDLYAEAGAMRIPRSHHLTLEWCAHFGLTLRPFVMDNPHGLVYVGGQRMVAGWDEIALRYDEMSLRDFLLHKGWSEAAIEMYGILAFLESDMANAVVEVLREDLGGAYVDMQEIVGGSDLLPRAFAADLADRIRYGAEVTALEQDGDGVTVHYKSEAGRWSERADHVLCTIPFSVLRTVEAQFSHEKQKAIRQLNYSASTKILFQCRERVWETDDGITGGATCTDLAIRRMNYPTPNPGTPRGVLLASYTWGQDAARWGAMDEESRLEQALEGVAKIHPRIREVYECGASWDWYGDRWAGGAFALFDPGQQGELYAAITQPEGRIHFAGEHCSLHHAWIQGALESGLREARAIAG